MRPASGDRRERLLRILRLMNADGTVSADMGRKLKQVERLCELLAPALKKAFEGVGRPVVWDLNCGSSYLGLLLLDHARATYGVEPTLAGVDRDPARIDACRRRAAAAGFPDAVFVHGSVADAVLPPRPALVLSLHGCDVATDEALLRAVRAEAATIAVVPCCQRELRGLLRRVPPHVAFLRDPSVAADYGALLTDAARVAALRALGYRVDVAEFVGPEHTLKNRLLRATAGGKPDSVAASELRAVVAACTTPPAFAALLPA